MNNQLHTTSTRPYTQRNQLQYSHIYHTHLHVNKKTKRKTIEQKHRQTTNNQEQSQRNSNSKRTLQTNKKSQLAINYMDSNMNNNTQLMRNY